MTGELFGAEQLERWCVVNRVYQDDDFERLSRELARSSRPDRRAPTR